MHKAFSLPVMEFPLPREVPTASEESFHCQKKRDATAHKIALLLKSSSNCQSNSYDLYAKRITLNPNPLHSQSLHQEMDQQNPTLAKILILDTGKFEQWQFRIQQYLQHEHYALWEVIEFVDYYEAPANVATTGTSSDGTGKKKGGTVEILKTFGGNEATKKTKKNLLKQQYGNFKAEGSETLEQTFNRLQMIVSQLQFMDVEIEQDDLNQKFLTKLPEFKDDIVTDYSRPSPTIESTSDDAQNKNPSEASPSTISPKSFIKFVKANDSPTKSKTDKVETAKKPPVKYVEQYRKPTKKPNVRGNQRNWNNLKSHQLGPNFMMEKKACFNCGEFNHLAYDCSKRVKMGHIDHIILLIRVSHPEQKFPTGDTKFSTADMGKKGKAVKASA
nr:ribonuclease H-like domain-containing protein [Tanacetum cinerariifolium]